MKHETFPPQTPSLEELLWSWPTVCRRAKADWAKSFALSIQGQSKRRNWKPTAKQLSLMRRMVSEIYTHREGDDDDLSLIE